MYELMVESQFSSAHQLRGYKGKCERLHGHNWRVQIVVSAEKTGETGLVIDFHELKRIVDEILTTIDHSVLNEVFPFTEINPSSENIAKWLYDSVKKKINSRNIGISSVTLWESENASATYYD